MFDRQASLDALTRHPRGGRVAKLPEDLNRYEKIIGETQPELVIETGTFEGFSAEWFADHGLQVITIDVDEWRSGLFRQFHGDQNHIRFLFGSSTDPQIIEQVAELAEGRRTMVSLDSDHSAAHVGAEIEAYGPLVSPGCYLVVEDGIARYIGSGQLDPLMAIETHLVGCSKWERDEETENLWPVSMHPMGWWRRNA